MDSININREHATHIRFDNHLAETFEPLLNFGTTLKRLCEKFLRTRLSTFIDMNLCLINLASIDCHTSIDLTVTIVLYYCVLFLVRRYR